MFQFIRKHQAIGLIFIGIVIVSFVIFFSPNQSGGGGMQRGALGTIGGEPIEQDEYLQARREAHLAQFFREGQWPGANWDQEQQTYNRLLMLHEAERLGIDVSDEVVARRIIDLGLFKDERTGTFNRAAYDQFLAGIAREAGISQAGFEEFIRHEVALQHLVDIGGLSGTLIPPSEAEARFREENSHFDLQLVTFAASNYLNQVDLSPTHIAQYYSNRIADYRIPERVQVRYVKFPGTNFLAEADQQLNSNSNLVQILDSEYQRMGPEAFRDTNGMVLSAEAAKEDLREQFRQRLALEAARKKAVEFANKLYKIEDSQDPLNQLATESGLIVETSLPFDQFRPPLDMNLPRTFNQTAFSLSAEEPFATPAVGEDAVFVYAFDKRIPSEFQPLEIVRDRVVDSLRRTESRAMAEAAGRSFVTSVQEGLTAGKSFEAIATEAGHAPLTLTNVAPTTPSLGALGPHLTVAELLRTAKDLQPGKASGLTPSAEGAYVLFVVNRTPPPDEEMKSKLPEFLAQQRQFGRYSAFVEWQRKRFAESKVQIPQRSGDRTNAPAAVN